MPRKSARASYAAHSAAMATFYANEAREHMALARYYDDNDHYDGHAASECDNKDENACRGIKNCQWNINDRPVPFCERNCVIRQSQDECSGSMCAWDPEYRHCTDREPEASPQDEDQGSSDDDEKYESYAQRLAREEMEYAEELKKILEGLRSDNSETELSDNDDEFEKDI